MTSARIVPPPGACRLSAYVAPTCAIAAVAIAAPAIMNRASLPMSTFALCRGLSIRRALADPFHPTVERPFFLFCHRPSEQGDVEGTVWSFSLHVDVRAHAVGQ